MDLQTGIAAALAPLCQLSEQEVLSLLEAPKNADMGDVAFPCFRLAKTMHKAPQAIAAELAAAIVLPADVSRAEAAGPYLNFFADANAQAASVLLEVLQQGDAYGHADVGKGRNVCVEFSSINIAKPFHIGHLPSTMIGNSLYRIYSALGYHAISINHLGDWGTQFGKMIVAYKLWGDKPIEQYTVRELVKLYVRYHEVVEQQPELDDQARAWFHRIEQGDAEATALWKQMKDATLREDAVVYDRLGVHFDSFAGESFYEDKMQAVIDELAQTGVSRVDKGMTIVDLSAYNMPPCIILKSDGSTIYATRDLAAAIYRKKEYDFARNLYVVAYQQDLHFRQFFKVLELMGRDWVKDCEHVNFGMVAMEEGTLSTRHGNVVYLDDVLQAAVDKTYEIICEKSPDLEDKRGAAEMVGVGAVVWSVLYQNRIKDTTFSWAKMLNFDGETGPYAQYTHARCCSVLRKAGGYDRENIDVTKLDDPFAQALLKAMRGLPEAVLSAAAKNEPYFVSRQVIAVCAAFNKFYYEQRIMHDDPAVRNARLALCDAARQVIANGLYLVGLGAPERM